MRTLLLNKQHQDVNPPLQAINTLYLSLLDGDADEATWALFNKVASLPLVTTKLQPNCITRGYFHMGLKEHFEGPCDNWPKCGHRNEEVSTTVTLTSVDAYMLERGQRLGKTIIAQWWGQQLAQALAATFIPCSPTN